MPKILRKTKSKAGATRLGALPEWDLSALYSGLDDPAIKRDLDRTDADCLAFEQAYKGKLAALAAAPQGGAALGEAVRRYEAISDLMGRLGSYAVLIHEGDTVDPARTKFYGDMQERMTAASTHLLFFELELNRIDDAQLEAALADPALGHYRPWLDDMRRYRPYQLEDRVEQLFHEKSMTAYTAWNRQFDATIANLRFKVSGKTLAIEPTLNFLQDRDGKKRKAAALALGAHLQGQRGAVRADHQHARQGQGNLRPLARLRRHRRRAASVEPGRARGGRCAGRGGARRLSAAVAPLLRAQGQMVRQEAAAAMGPQRAAAASRHPHHRLGRGQGYGADRLWRVLAENGGDRRAVFCRALDRRAGAARQGAGRVLASDDAVGASLSCCSTTRASRAT